jgi:two-component system, NtrC family, sensor kinase
MLNFIITIVAVNFIRKHIKPIETVPTWDNILDKLRFLAPFIFVGSHASDDAYKVIFDIVWLVVGSIIVYVLWLLRQNRTARVLIWAAIPYVFVNFCDNFIEFLAPKFHKNNDDALELAVLCSFFWMLAFGIAASYQQKALAKEEAKNRIIVGENERLEMLVAERTSEILNQKESLEKALTALKSTQNQLIQSEKLASLGELTAGIAHEIQNPLNFVNNFSEVSVELALELQEALRLAGIDAQSEAGEIVTDLIQNQEKINHHGKRASNIVKSMLEHSRTSTGERSPTDINALCDEYLRLSYHGMRAKDKSFNADFELITDPDLPKINIVSQDMGRVLLNLINNAFQSPDPHHLLTAETTANYRKKVIVKTFAYQNPNDTRGGLGVHISDNGAGIAADVLPKIFQPFFTTKPTGQGTGLGLSLSYDIVTKGHNGTMDVESIDNQATTFTIKLPIT